jgi:hypothetical protein
MLTRLRGLAGLAGAVIPAAVLVHLAAEALALGRATFGLDFVLRHLYLVVLLVAALLAFGTTLGFGAGRAEIRRRTALLRAQLAGRDPVGLLLVLAANLGFFALTQLGEGFPILSGTLWLGLGVGILGSLAAAVLVWAFGNALVVAAVEALEHAARRATAAPAPARRYAPVPSRAAASSFSLFVPNRPPPRRPSSDPSSLQKGTSCFHPLARRDRRLRFSSPFSSC